MISSFCIGPGEHCDCGATGCYNPPQYDKWSIDDFYVLVED